MATDYSKKKNDELAALCKERGLAHTGKKADLVKRLEESDAKGTTAKPAGGEDEIDWDDEPATETAKTATSEPAANAIAAAGVGEVANPQAVPNQSAAVDPAQTDDLSVGPPAATAANGAVAPPEESKEEKDFSSGIADRTLDEEIEKRKARARKFGMPEDSDEIKALERAKRFGTSDVPGMLNKALPEGRDRKRARDGDDGGSRKSSRGPRGSAGRGGRGGRREGGRSRADESGSGGNASWMSEKDREAAERRRAKFATST